MNNISKILGVGIAGLLLGLQAAQAVPVVVNFDASYEGLAKPDQNVLTAGVIEVGWVIPGTTSGGISGLFNAQDYTGIDAAFNQVFTITFTLGGPNTFGNGLVFESATVVPDGNATALAAYKNPATGAAGKNMFAWIRNSPALGATEQAFVRSPNLFPTANDIIGFTDWSEGFGTDVFSITPADAWVGSLSPVIVGSGVDTNGGSAVNGLGQNGGTHVLVLAQAVPEPSTTLLLLGGLSPLALRRRRA